MGRGKPAIFGYFGGAAVTSAVVAGGILFFIGYKIGKSDAPQPASETARY